MSLLLYVSCLSYPSCPPYLKYLTLIYARVDVSTYLPFFPMYLLYVACLLFPLSLSLFLSVYLSFCLSLSLPIYIHLPRLKYFFFRLSINPSAKTIYLGLPIYLSAYLTSYLIESNLA